MYEGPWRALLQSARCVFSTRNFEMKSAVVVIIVMLGFESYMCNSFALTMAVCVPLMILSHGPLSCVDKYKCRFKCCHVYGCCHGQRGTTVLAPNGRQALAAGGPIWCKRGVDRAKTSAPTAAPTACVDSGAWCQAVPASACRESMDMLKQCCKYCGKVLRNGGARRLQARLVPVRHLWRMVR